MQEAYVNINGVPTHIMTWGKWIEESLGAHKEIVVCITGNPGLPGFYAEFLGALYKQLDCKMPVWVIGHAGHDDPPESSMRQVPQLMGNENMYDLDGQLRHKRDFINKYVPEDVKIHLIGHSIGAWMILQLLEKSDVHKRIKKCYLLFPTIERMVETTNGFVFTKIALPLYSVFGFLISIMHRLPQIFLILFIQLYFWLSSIPNHLIGTAIKYSKPTVMEKVCFLAEDEMAKVCALQRNLVEKHMPLLKLYYGTTDGWVPVKYYKQLREAFPDIDAELDTKKIDHAFVLRFSKLMSGIVADMIAQNSQVRS